MNSRWNTKLNHPQNRPNNNPFNDIQSFSSNGMGQITGLKANRGRNEEGASKNRV